MAWDITVEFPLWGENGEFPQDGFFYEGGDQLNEKHLDALWNGTQTLQDETESALEDIDSDRDGVVDEAEQANNATNVKGNDIDSNGDGKVNAADDADTVGGEPPSNFADTNHGNEEHSEDFTTLTEVNNNADVPNADFADQAGDADTVDGIEATEIALSLSSQSGSENASLSAGNSESGTIFTTTDAVLAFAVESDLFASTGTSLSSDSAITSVDIVFEYADGSESTALANTVTGDRNSDGDQVYNDSIYNSWGGTTLAKKVDNVRVDYSFEHDASESTSNHDATVTLVVLS